MVIHPAPVRTLCAALAILLLADRVAHATVTILANENDFQSTPTLINFNDITFCSPTPCSTSVSVTRYQAQGVHISDGSVTDCSTFACSLTGTSGAAAYSETAGSAASGCGNPPCSIPAHSPMVAIADSDIGPGNQGGCVVIRFVVPGTATPTSVLEAGIWVNGAMEADCVQFYDGNQTLLATIFAPADSWTFVGVRATEGVRFIRYLGVHIGLPSGGGYLVDDLKFGGTPGGGNQPPVISGADPMTLNVRCNSDCPNANNNLALSATDPDGSAAALMWSIQTSPVRGSLSPTTATGANFTTCYDPNNMQTLGDSYVVKVADPGGAMDTVAVNVTILNDPPVITEGATTFLAVARNSICGCPTCPDTANIVSLSATDLETVAGNLTWTVTALPNTGTVCFQGGQMGGSVTLRYTPNAGQMAADAFAVRVSDDCGANDVITVNISVSAACSSGQKGDIDLNGVVDGADVQTFVETLLNPASKTAAVRCRADVGSSGNPCTPDDLVNVNDVPGFSALLLTGACP